MRERTSKLLKRVGRVAAWIGGGGTLVVGTFAISFCVAMKQEMRSTEVIVPDLNGLMLEAAEEAAAPLGLRTEVVDQRNDPEIASGRVLQQDPLPGSSVRRGRRIKLVLSLGARVLTVPQIVGRTSRTVGIALNREGFAPGNVSNVHSYTAAEGTVISQVPPPSSPSVPGERVHQLVSLGPPEIRWQMPDVTGRSRDEVERWVRLCGLRLGPVRVVTRPGARSGMVVAQRPLAGYPIRAKGVVHLSVAR